MKKSINAWSVDSNSNFEEMFRDISKAGFDGIELNLDNAGNGNHSLTFETTAKELDEIMELSKKYSLPVVSISSSLYGGNMGSAKCENREFAKRILKKQLECAKALKAGGILVVPGGIDADVSILQAYKNSKETLVSCFDIINEYKLYVGVENVWNTFFTSPFDMKNFIDNINNKYIKAYYDVGNVVAFSNTEYWLEILGERIKLVHIKDFKRTSGFNLGGDWVDLQKGSINWKKVICEFKKIEYDGYITAEISKYDDSQSFFDFYLETVKIMDGIFAL